MRRGLDNYASPYNGEKENRAIRWECVTATPSCLGCVTEVCILWVVHLFIRDLSLMKTLSLYTLLFLTFMCIGCQPDAKDEPAANMEAYGAGVTLAESVHIAEIMADPAAFVGKKVRIEGRIKDVCSMKGCWIEIEDEDGDKALKVKVNDGEIVFKTESIGSHAIAEGEIYEIDLSEEQAVSYMAHLAEEKGEEFDPATVEGPMKIYQIKGEGALIGE